MNIEVEEKQPVKPIVVPTYTEEKKEKKSLLGKFKKRKKRPSPVKKEDIKVEKKEKVLRQTPSLLPFLEIEDTHIVLKNGVMDIFQITSKDLHSLNDEDINFLLFTQGKNMRSYYPSYKEVTLNFPSNLQKQKAYWLKKKNQTNDPIRLRYIDRKLFEFDFLEKERTNREFFLFIYADNPHQLEERKRQFIRSTQQSFPLMEISNEKKQDVLFVLNNQNSKI